MLGHRAKLVGGAEWDVFTPWRKVLCYTSRAGVCKSIKRKFNRRMRRMGKLDTKREATWTATPKTL